MSATGDEESAQAEKQLATEKRDGLQVGQDAPAESEPTSAEEAPTPNNEALREPSTSPPHTQLSLSLAPTSTPPSSPQEVDTSSTSGTVQPTWYGYVSPSPIPSEHSSDGSPWWLLAHHSAVDIVTSETCSASPRSLASTETLYYDLSAPSSPLSSGHAIVCDSANEILDYVSADRAYFGPGPGSVQLSSYSPLGPLEPGPASHQDITLTANVAGPSTSTTTQRLHCRICLRDPCEEMTATICGHIFCKRCITQAVVAKSECPVCKSAILLYCLFRLDLSV
ncbi:hypothetical protein BDN67DRAFT_1072912 [Paxillus ammoniavirescens]|nr:hypothetical protein BDN67DRAFT_1072912 [Paxillus ammoniavirescens]